MILIGVVAGLIVGILAGGKIGNLANVRLRWATALFAAVVVRFATEAALNADIALVERARLPLFAGAFALLLFALWSNRRQPGMSLAFVGILANTIAIVVNGGSMPIWTRSLEAIGMTPADITSRFHTILGPDLGAEFLLRAGPLVDVIPIPLLGNVASVGDLFLAGGLAFFLFATVVGPADEAREEEEEVAFEGELRGLAGTTRLPRTIDQALARRPIRAETGLAPGLAEASALERPLVLGGTGAGLAGPAIAPLPRELAAEQGVAIPRPPAVFERARQHAYVRLALNGSFSALWVGQLISLFGDRVHQVALAFLVLQATNSPIAVGLVFVAATLPNLILGPIAGTFVDRWDQKEVMVVSDLLRAAAVLVVPVAAVTNLVLVYPLVFLVTAISIFFRPARTAVMPRIVREDELLTANSATWVGETMADVVGYPLAGLFVAFLGSALPLAFWLDAATYVASAVLIATIFVPPARAEDADAEKAPGFMAEMREGWRFLRNETVLLANTAQATVGQFAIGVTLAVMPVYARDGVDRGPLEPTAVYAFLETGVGVGNLIGGFVIGLVGARLAKGRMVIVGYTAWGLCTALLAATGHVGIAIGLTLGSGIANMVFVIPSQTMFQERTPPGLIGRVVGFRFAIVFGSLTLAMAISGILAQAIGPGPVLGMFGLLTMAAGLAGILVPAVRDA